MDIKDLANLGCGAIAIVGHDIAHDGHATGSVAFVECLFDIATVDLAGPLLDGSFDIVLGETERFGFEDGGAQADVAVGIPLLVWQRR
ncbi:MAG: hypothetical protein R3C56_05120 [Pirellulaceae bacterium]